MLRSLFAGVSGLSSNIVELDVVGNNISNVNTVGFKSARVTFEELLTQNLRSATRPVSDGIGGTNPQQIGLGAVVGSIDSEFTQGNLRTTGNKTDLAIQGNGFFVLNDGTSNAYTRAGNFTFDGNNTLVASSTGLKVQGVTADQFGSFQAGAVGDIVIDPSSVVPAQASTVVNVFGNLSSQSDAVGTHMESDNPFLALTVGTDQLTGLHHGGTGADLKLSVGDTIVLQGDVGGVTITDANFQVGTDGDTVADLVNFIQSTLSSPPYNLSVNVLLDANGNIQIENTDVIDVAGLQLSSGGRTEFNQLFNFANIDAGETGISVNNMLSPATADDLMSELYNGDGDLLGFQFDPLTNESAVSITGTLGNDAITPRFFNIVDGVTTFQEFLDQMTGAFSISNGQGISVTDDGLIDVEGDIGAVNNIENIQVTEVSNQGSALSRSFDFRTLSEAKDSDTYSVTTSVFDSLGNSHNLTLDFTKRSGFNIWDWNASFDNDEEILSGESGTVVFDERGGILSFLYTDGGGQIQFRPQPLGEQGAEVVELVVNPGDVGERNGLTQFEPVDTIQSFADGFTVGRLVDFDIDSRGVVTGRFSNDTVRDLARLSLARFANPGGLTRQGNNSFVLSGNSGQAINGFAGEGGMGGLTPGALEASNVDLAEQFTRLVVAQRAFQSNARVISTGDEILQELVNIV